jgi:hypothetical protein
MMSNSKNEDVPESVFTGLRKFNAFMGVLHLVQSIVLYTISNDFALPLKTFYLNYNSATEALETVANEVAMVRLGPGIALFLFISAVAHFTLASPWGYGWYKRNLKRHINYLRWYEYAISSSVMIVIIAMLTGVYDLAALIPIFIANACMNLFGLGMELLNQHTEKTNWTLYIFGCIAGAAPWIVIAMHLMGAGGDGGGVPTFVYYIFFTIFVFFMSFAVNMILQYMEKGPWRSYYFGEKMYIVLSLVAKTALAWQVFFGTLRPV